MDLSYWALVASNNEIKDLERGNLVRIQEIMTDMILMAFRAYWVYGGDETVKVIGASSYRAFWYAKEFRLEYLDQCFQKCDIWGDFRRYIIECFTFLMSIIPDSPSHVDVIPFLSMLPWHLGQVASRRVTPRIMFKWDIIQGVLQVCGGLSDSSRVLFVLVSSEPGTVLGT